MKKTLLDFEKKQRSASSQIQLLIKVLLLMALLIVGFFAIFKIDRVKIIRIMDQDNRKEFFSIPVATSYTLTFGWIHSLEHIPWTEEYIIQDNNSLLLKKITIPAFGAGIPHNRGKATRIEEGLIIMDEIDEEFDEINWIHSQTATEYIMLNDKILLKGEDLPHHESLNLKIEKRLKIWPRQK